MTRAVTTGDVAKGAGAALLSRLGAVIEVVAQPAYVWMFGLATYGLYTVLWALVNLVENVADLGMTSALQRIVPQARDEMEAVAALRAALLLGILPCLLVAVLAFVAAAPVAGLLNVAADDQLELVAGVRLFVWALPLWALVEIGTSALRARRVFGPEIRLRVVWEQLIRLVAAAVFWVSGFGAVGLLAAHVVSLLLTAAWCVRLLARHYELRLLLRAPWDRRVLRATWLAGISVLPTNIVSRLFTDAPPILLNLSFAGAAGATSAGLYGIARKLSSLVQLVRMAFSYVMGPLASAAARDDIAAVRPIYGFATRLSTVLAIPIAAALIAGGDVVLRLFGPGAGAAWMMMAALTAGRAFETILGQASAIQQVASRHRDPIIGSIAGLGIGGILASILLPVAGGDGLAVAVSAGLVTSAAVSVIQLHRDMGIHPFAPPFARSLAVAALAGGGIGMIDLLSRSLPWTLQIPVMIISLAAGMWFAARCGLPAEDKQSMGRVAARLYL